MFARRTTGKRSVITSYSIHYTKLYESTGIGRGIAIPHCRSLVVNQLRVAYGRKQPGVDFNAIDGKPVTNFFLIVAPPLEVSNQYLPVTGCKDWG